MLDWTALPHDDPLYEADVDLSTIRDAAVQLPEELAGLLAEPVRRLDGLAAKEPLITLKPSPTCSTSGPSCLLCEVKVRTLVGGTPNERICDLGTQRVGLPVAGDVPPALDHGVAVASLPHPVVGEVELVDATPVRQNDTGLRLRTVREEMDEDGGGDGQPALGEQLS
ncbi:hypothetical protein ABZY81_38535 [Streptomyces sp. NPDC006514]|uniref:hypothetical protein n=1 Tax=Streptomyces sp. NPDC006514 TaxID=3154308 RepID=UPI0033BC836B